MSAWTCMMLTFSVWYDPRVLRETGAKTRETGAKMRETGAKKKVYHFTLLVLILMTCHVFLKTIFAHRPNRRHGPKRRPRRGIMSLWVACCFSLFLGSSPSHLWVFYLDSRCANSVFFPRVHVMCALCVVTVMLLCWILHALPEDSSDGKNQCPTIDGVLCENCAMGKGCVLEVAWGMKSIRDVGVDTSDLPCPKLDCWHVLWCNPCCQSWLFEVVFGMLDMH